MSYVHSVKRASRGRQFRSISYHGNGGWTFCYSVDDLGIIDDLVIFFIRSGCSIAAVDVSHEAATSEPLISRGRISPATTTCLGFRTWGLLYI
jgi:hypothetical protein